MKKNRILSMALCLTMSAGILQGCGNAPAPSQQPDGGSAPVMEYDMTFFEWGWEGPEDGKDEVLPLIEEKTGVKINLHRWIIASEEDYRRQLSLWVASDKLPEIMDLPVDTYTVELANQLGEAGKLYEVSGLTEKMIPESHQMLEDCMAYYQDRKTGKRYFYPTQINDYDAIIEMDNTAQNAIMIRKDWLDELGLGYPKTPEELYTTLKRFKEEIKLKDGQSIIPLTFTENLAGTDNFLAMFFDESDRAFRFRQLPDGTFTNEWDQQKLGNYLNFMNKLYRDGLMDPEVATIKASQYQERINSGRVGVTSDAWWNLNTFNDNLQAANPETMYVYMPYPKAEGVTKAVQQFVPTGAPCGFLFSKSMPPEKFDKAVEVFSFMSTVEGVTLSTYGKEGLHWEKNADGKIQFTENFMEETAGDWNKQAQRGVGYYLGMAPKTSLINGMVETPGYLKRPDIVESRKNLQGTIFQVNGPQDMVPPGPIETNKSSAINAQFRELIVQAILAPSQEECQKLIDRWPATWEGLGGKEIVAEKNELVKTAQG